MPAPLMNADEMKQWVLRRMGAPLLRVEITDDQLDDCIENAKRWFSAKKGVKRQAIMAVTSGQPEYDLPDEVDVVLDVAFATSPMDISLIFSPFMLIDEKVPYDVFAAPGSAGLYSSFTQTLQYVEMAKRILSADADWRQEGRKLQLFPCPRVDLAVVIDFKTHCVTVEQLNERDHDLVKRFAYNEARFYVARVRTKYADYPTAQGTATLDGEKLMEEYSAELERLEDEISLSGFPIGILTG
jgi:hypothetical protein